jgi:hypothetical protein
MYFKRLVCVVGLVSLLPAPVALAEQPASVALGTVEGRVETATGVPLPNSRVWLVELGRATSTDAEGNFRFVDVASGTYQLLAETEIRTAAVQTVTVQAGAKVTTVLVGDIEAFHLNEVVQVMGRSDDMIRVAESASRGVTGQQDLADRPVLRPAQLLETVPGMVATQHSGGGKANQYFVRGFNLDHGTDFRLTVDGVPVNMPTHGHGQGYADLNFLIPELVEKVDYLKGPYFAEEGDFSAAGAARFTYFDRLSDPIVIVSAGSFSHARALAAGSVRVGGGDLLGSFDYTQDDGPWERPDDFKKVSAILRYTRRSTRGGWRLDAQAYDGSWSATDQIPQRAVDSGELSRFGFVDPTNGGTSSRYMLSGDYWRAGTRSLTALQAYAFSYDLSLFSNFTYALADPENGDQFEQRDDRFVTGFKFTHRWTSSWAERSVDNIVGIDLRNDWIDNGLFSTRERLRFATTRQDSITQLGAGPFVENRTEWNAWLRTVAGLRVDVYRVNVESDNPLNSGERSDAMASPKFSVLLGPWSNTELYANFGGGYHSNDGRGATITVDPVTGESVPPVDPLVRAWGFDLGVRTRLFENLHTTVTFFGLDLDSELLFIGDGGTTEASRPSRRRGVEWTNYFQPVDGLKLDADLAFTRARFDDDDPDDRIPGAMEVVVATGATLDVNRWTATLRWRYFGTKPLVEDNSVRGKASSFVTARLAYAILDRLQVGFDVFNLFDQDANDIDYFYASRLPAEPSLGLEDIHFHPLQSRSVRFFLRWSP